MIFQVHLFSLIGGVFCFLLFFLLVSVPTIDMCPPPNLNVNPLVYVKFVDVAVVLWRAR